MSALEQDLNEFMMGDEPDLAAVPEPPRDAEDANRKLRRIAALHARIAEHDALHQAETRRLDEWLDRVETPLRRQIRWLAEGLEMWHRAVLADDPARKTISLPCGTLKSRAQQPAWEFDDEVFIPWAQKWAPDLVRVPEPRPVVDRTQAKKALNVPDDLQPGESTHAYDAQGDIPPGVTVTARPPSFTVVTEVVE